jgi:hypothetical protein
LCVRVRVDSSRKSGVIPHRNFNVLLVLALPGRERERESRSLQLIGLERITKQNYNKNKDDRI